MAKYIFVTGGVVSGLGKGITAASLGRLLKSRGLKVAAQKLDPYINVVPGTMSPYQHLRRTWTWATMSGSSTRTSTSSPTLPPARCTGTC